MKAKLLVVGVALLMGMAGYVAPGCVADWAFLREARVQTERKALEDRVKQLAAENAALKAQPAEAK